MPFAFPSESVFAFGGILNYRRFLEGDLVLGQIRRGSLRVCATEIGFYDFAAHLH